MPGANTRTVTHYDPFPIGIERGEGCRLWDVDGNAYIDLLNNYTPLVHGHAHPRHRRGHHAHGDAGAERRRSRLRSLCRASSPSGCARAPRPSTCVRFTNSASRPS